MSVLVRLVIILVLLSGSVGMTDVHAKSSKDSAAATDKNQSLGTMEDGKAYIQALKESAEALTDYSFRSQIVTYKGSNAIREAGHFYYKKPNLLRLEVLSGPKKGALLVQGSDGKIRGHLGGVLKMFTGSVGKDSKFLISSNGFNMVECDYATLFGNLQGQITAGVKSEVTPSPVSVTGKSQKMIVVDIRRGEGQEGLQQRIYVDPATKLPQEWQIYKDGKLFCTTVWSDIKTNQGLTAAAFTLNWRG